jgi:hypothetical protein
MAGDKNHYELAFSGLLVDAGVRALAVDEARRPVLNGIELKNFDFLVNGLDAVWALDLKGRRDRPWITRTDMFSMMSWATLLKHSARPAFVFSFFRRAHEAAGRVAALNATIHETPGGVYRFCVLTIERSGSNGTHSREVSCRWMRFCRLSSRCEVRSSKIEARS